MPITYTTGDATNPIGKGNKVIVHCCNDIGAWGSGFVLAISKKWKEPELQYRKFFRHLSKEHQLATLGTIYYVQVEKDIWVANLIGQRSIRSDTNTEPVRYWAITQGLEDLAVWATVHQASVHMPRMGCGLAGGKWSEIEKCINNTLIKSDISVTVYDFKP